MFDRQVRDKELPTDLPEHAWDAGWGDALALPNLLKEIGLCASTSEARRAIKQGGVRIDGDVVKDERASVDRSDERRLVQVGKKRAAYLSGVSS